MFSILISPTVWHHSCPLASVAVTDMGDRICHLATLLYSWLQVPAVGDPQTFPSQQWDIICLVAPESADHLLHYQHWLVQLLLTVTLATDPNPCSLFFHPSILKHLNQGQALCPHLKGRSHSFSSENHGLRLWRCWLSSQPLHTLHTLTLSSSLDDAKRTTN